MPISEMQLNLIMVHCQKWTARGNTEIWSRRSVAQASQHTQTKQYLVVLQTKSYCGLDISVLAFLCFLRPMKNCWPSDKLSRGVTDKRLRYSALYSYCSDVRDSSGCGRPLMGNELRIFTRRAASLLLHFDSFQFHARGGSKIQYRVVGMMQVQHGLKAWWRHGRVWQLGKECE